MAVEHYEHSLALRLERSGRVTDAIKRLLDNEFISELHVVASPRVVVTVVSLVPNLTNNELEDRKTQANALQNLWDSK